MENSIQKTTSHYTGETKQQLIEQWKQSGLSRLAFCRQKNFSYYTLIRWTRKTRKENILTSTGFIPLKLKSSSATLFARIESGNGKSIQLFQSVSASYLKQLFC